jgi:hypothetical protein
VTRTVNSHVLAAMLMPPNMPSTTRGTMPTPEKSAPAAGSRGERPGPPCIVCVFPLPVCPYARMVPFTPLSAASTMGRPIASNTASCVESGPNSESKGPNASARPEDESCACTLRPTSRSGAAPASPQSEAVPSARDT